MKDKCPRCSGGWALIIGKDDTYRCRRDCGMRLLAGVTLAIAVGEYEVYWSGAGDVRVFNSDHDVVIWDPLPFDVTLDMIKMMLTFQ